MYNEGLRTPPSGTGSSPGVPSIPNVYAPHQLLTREDVMHTLTERYSASSTELNVWYRSESCTMSSWSHVGKPVGAAVEGWTIRAPVTPSVYCVESVSVGDVAGTK